MGLASVTLGYGLVLLLAALSAAWFAYRQSALRLLFVALAFLLYGVPAEMLHARAGPALTWVAPLVEEPVKLAVIAALRARAGLCVVVCVAFAATELVDKALGVASIAEAQGAALLPWLAGTTGAVLVHAATGFVYAFRPAPGSGVLLVAAVALHLGYNLLVALASERLSLAAAAAAGLATGAVLLLAAMLLWSRLGRPAGP